MFYKFGDMTSKEIERAVEQEAFVVFPIGAIEQHGPHLPFDTDDYYANRWAVAACKKAVEQNGDCAYY
jgi:creatinine amidohydrolase